MMQIFISIKDTMERSDLELVLAVRDQGSLTAAALQLNVEPPAVTKRLAALEARLGHRLFQRTTRRVSPTAEGETLCLRAESLLQGFAELEAELQERKREPTGLIRLVSTFGFGRLWLGTALADFQQRFPRVEIQLHLTEELPDLAAEGFDGAIWLWSVKGQQAAQWVSRRLAFNQRVMAASPDYLQRFGMPLTLDELKNHDCLQVRENGSRNGVSRGSARAGINARFNFWTLQHRRDKSLARVAVHGPLSSNSGELVRDWGLQGRGIMLRSLWDIAPQLASGRLIHVLPEWTMPDADVHWLAPYRTDSPKRIRLLIDHLVAQFSGEPWKTGLKDQAVP
ncbi:MAG: LysR family transcriptional regulator [Polaromonas sp.]|nr:LysR family transcriptional regulator [Polaromonas sp.]